MSEIYNQLLFRPLFNFLVFIYNILPGGDFGWSIIVLTFLVRLIFSPLSIKALASQKELNKLQPKLKELQEKHKGDRQTLGQATMALYKEHKINPFSGCLPLLIQLPFLIAVYKILASGLKTENLKFLYSFVNNPGFVDETAFGFLDLAHKAPPLAVAAGALQWFQSKLAFSHQGKTDAETKGGLGGQQVVQQMSKQMLYFFPIMIIIIAWNLPAGLVLYWVTTTVFSIFEQLYVNRKYK